MRNQIRLAESGPRIVSLGEGSNPHVVLEQGARLRGRDPAWTTSRRPVGLAVQGLLSGRERLAS
jgi:hypothetical protein